MPVYVPILIVVGVIAIIAGGIAAAIIYDKKRTEKWRMIAQDMNFEFVVKSPGPPEGYQFKLFTRGRSKNRKNVMSGETNNVSVMMCDYRYTTGSGKNSSTHTQTICIIRDSVLDLPGIFMRREMGFFDKLGEMFGGQDIDFADDPVFSKAFVLQGDNEEEIRQIFTPELRSMLAGRSKEFSSFEAVGDTIMVSTGRYLKPEKAKELLELTFTIKQNLA